MSTAHKTSGSCYPNPCGPHSICEVVGPRVVCKCKPGFFGKPNQCHPECLVSEECRPNQACIRQKCEEPCIDVCGEEWRINEMTFAAINC